MVKDTWVDSFSCSVVAAFKNDSQKWMVTGLVLDEFFNELEEVRGRRDILWCIRGDFNEVLFMEEQNRATRKTRGMDTFGDFVDQNELIDVPLLGARFTWSNFQKSSSLSKLDRFLH